MQIKKLAKKGIFRKIGLEFHFGFGDWTASLLLSRKFRALSITTVTSFDIERGLNVTLKFVFFFFFFFYFEEKEKIASSSKFNNNTN